MTAIGHGNASRVTVDRAIELAIATGVAVLVAIGFVTSYETLRSLAVTDGGFASWLAPAVPLSFDLGVVVLSLKIVASARRGRHALVHRALVACLSVATVAVNGTASTGTAGRFLHAVPPAMFVICFEGLIADARRDALARRRRSPTRWKAALLAPVRTLRSWREGVLRSTSLQPNGAVECRSPTSATARTPSTPTRSAVGGAPPMSDASNDRLSLTRESLRRNAQLTAPELVRALRDHGHDVSVRTAQRLKARAACPE